MKKKLEQMSLQEKLGQCFSVGFPGTELTEEFIGFLKKYHIGNIILFQENIRDMDQLYALCGQLRGLILKNTGQEPFIMIDQEGGAIVRLTDDGVNVPGAMALAAAGEPENAYLAGRFTGKQLRRLGINFDLAPVMDVNTTPDCPSLGMRSYGDRPEQVAEYAVRMAEGLAEEGVLSCAKHFPGHGGTSLDSHVSLPEVTKTMEEMEQVDLYPFRWAVEKKLPAIMSAHILFPALEPERVPATMSRRILTGLLRERWGFEGLILSDCMEMAAIRQYYGTAQGVLTAFRAGVDVVLISHTPSAAGEALELLEAEAARDVALQERMEEAAGLVLAMKERYAWEERCGQECAGEGSLAEQKEQRGYLLEEERLQAYEMLKKTFVATQLPEGKIPDLGDKPLFAGCHAFRISLVGNVESYALSFPEWMAGRLGGDSLLFSPDPDEAEIQEAARKAQGHSSMIIGIHNGHLKTGQLKLVERLSELGIPVIVFALRNPYDLKSLPAHITAMAAWEYSVRSFAAIVEILRGEWLPAGKMPIAWGEEKENA